MPDGVVLALAGVDLLHATVGDIDAGLAIGFALQAGAEFVALAGGIERIEHLAQAFADDVLRQLGAVFGPVGLENAQLTVFHRVDEAVFQPEVASGLPELVGCTINHEPMLGTVALDADVANLVGRGVVVGRLGGLGIGLHGSSGYHATRDGIARVLRQLRQIRRDFKRGSLILARALVVDLGLLERGRAGRQAQRDAEQAQTCCLLFHADCPWVAFKLCAKNR